LSLSGYCQGADHLSFEIWNDFSTLGFHTLEDSKLRREERWEQLFLDLCLGFDLTAVAVLCSSAFFSDLFGS
jgi:hypothetical protein